MPSGSADAMSQQTYLTFPRPSASTRLRADSWISGFFSRLTTSPVGPTISERRIVTSPAPEPSTPRYTPAAQRTACPVPCCSNCSANSTRSPYPDSASRTSSCLYPTTATTRPHPASRHASTTAHTIGRPPTSWQTFGRSLFMRVPLPAASTIAERPRCDCPVSIIASGLARTSPPGLEPGLDEPKSPVLPITPRGTVRQPGKSRPAITPRTHHPERWKAHASGTRTLLLGSGSSRPPRGPPRRGPRSRHTGSVGRGTRASRPLGPTRMERHPPLPRRVAL